MMEASEQVQEWPCNDCAKQNDGPLTTSTQLRRGKFKQRPGEKWQGCQFHDSVRPSIGPTAAKQQGQSDDKER